MNKVLAVARWEYIERLRSKAFLISLFLMPVILVGMGILPSVFAMRPDSETRVIGVIDRSGALATEFARRMEEYTLPDGRPNYLVQVIASGSGVNPESAIEEANAMVTRGEIEGYCIIQENVFADSLVEFRGRNVGDFRLTNRIEENLRILVSENKLASMGLDPSVMKQLRSPFSLKSVKLSATGEQEETGFERMFFTAYVFMMMLFFLILTTGQMLVRSVIEEKFNRIIEVLVSSCSSTELMAGKVLGLSALGFTQIGFWSVIGLSVSAQFSIDLIPLTHVLLLALYFILGYLFYAAIFIGLGAPVTTEQEAQQITSYLVLIVVMPIALAIPAIQTPGAQWLKILTYIPFLTPTMMALRIPIEMPTPVELVTTSAILAASAYLAMIAAGRIFRVAILATGKRPGFREILHWVRTGY